MTRREMPDGAMDDLPGGYQHTKQVIAAIDAGWAEEDIERGIRIAPGTTTFVCDGCGQTYPRSLAMNASMGTTCPDCYDDLSG